MRLVTLSARLVTPIFLCACAAGRDSLDGNGTGVPTRDAGTQAASGYVYTARGAIVAVGLAEQSGFSEDETHAFIDHVAKSADACFKRSANLKAGAARVIINVDPGGVAAPPDVTFSPTEAAPIGLLCLLQPIRISTFAPADAGVRSMTIESAWNP